MEELTRALRRSGLLSGRPGVSVVTHTGAYHLAYLMKVLNGGDPLPGDMAGFLGSVRRSLGEDVYDVARMVADCRDMPGGGSSTSPAGSGSRRRWRCTRSRAPAACSL